MASELSSCVKVEVAAMHARTEHETCLLRIKKYLSLDSDDFGLLLLA